MASSARLLHRAPSVPVVLALLVYATLASGTPCRAAGPDDAPLDATSLNQREDRAANAQAKERCYLYTELLHDWTELAGRAITAGDDAAATMAMQHADADMSKLKGVIDRDSKRLKNAELLLEHTARRLSDMVRVATMDQHDAMQIVLKHLNSVHDAVLAQIFSH